MITDLTQTYIKANSQEEADRIQAKIISLGFKPVDEYVPQQAILKLHSDKQAGWWSSCGGKSHRQITLSDLFGEQTVLDEEFKKGDVVVVTENIEGNNSKVGMVYTYHSKSNGSLCPHFVTVPGGEYSYCKAVRHATQAEKSYHAEHGDGCVFTGKEGPIPNEHVTITETMRNLPVNETNLEKAKRLYPVGTEFKSVAGTATKPFKVLSNSHRVRESGSIYVEVDLQKYKGKAQERSVWMKGQNKWAEIVPAKTPIIRVSAELDAIVDGLVKGEVYQCESGVGTVVFKYHSSHPKNKTWHIQSDLIYGNACIIQDSFSNHDWIRTITPATPEQIIWLEECEKAGTFMSKDEAKSINAARKYHVDFAKTIVEASQPQAGGGGMPELVKAAASILSSQWLKPEDMKEGQIYFIEEMEKPYLIIRCEGGFSKEKKMTRCKASSVDISGLDRFAVGLTCYHYPPNGRRFREATFSERLWLQKCIDAGKFLLKYEATGGLLKYEAMGNNEFKALKVIDDPFGAEAISGLSKLYYGGIDPVTMGGASLLVDEFGIRYPLTEADAFPPKQHDPTNLKPANKKLKPMMVSPISKFNNLVTPKSNKK